MGIQEEIEKAKEGILKDIAKVWVNAGYTAEDFKLLKDLAGDAIFNYERQIEDFNTEHHTS